MHEGSAHGKIHPISPSIIPSCPPSISRYAGTIVTLILSFRELGDMRQIGSVLWPKLRVLQVYGANTDVGKTIFSSILSRAFQKRFPKVHYLKPISTGPLEEADDRHLATLSSNIRAKCLYQFADPVSPHIAARSSAKPITDSAIQAAVHDELTSYATGEDGIAIVETAGGVLSPSPSGSSQADLYRPLRLPIFLVGDHQLGGIGTTISAWESLHIRGYDVHTVALFAESRYDNHTYLKEYFADRGVHAFSVPPPPTRDADSAQDAQNMQSYYDETSSSSAVSTFTGKLLADHDARIADLSNMPAEAVEAIWHPFMQHSERSASTLTAIDSAYGDHFAISTPNPTNPVTPNKASTPLLKPAFDASASWWTQGLGHGNPVLALTAAHAAGRYGHVMFASAIHAPALRLAQTLLTNLGNKRLAKVFYTDNGSAGMEVAVKMGIRAAATRHGWEAGRDEIVILGLKGSYHGDTMGTMDCSEPSIYNQKEPWYTGRGHWLDFPQVKMRAGEWLVETPEELQEALGGTRTFDSLDAVFDFETRKEDGTLYREYCAAILTRLAGQGTKFGALVMEPLLLGAGGMIFADPLFQRSLVDAVRASTSLYPSSTNPRHEGDWTGMPVICDEIFTGLYRLGRFSAAASFLGVEADIVANAKLLTGGVLPLCTTTASQGIFDAFVSGEKTDALLHGHSYTAHPVGCSVANESLRTMMRMERDGAWDAFQKPWTPSAGQGSSTRSPGGGKGVWSYWSPSFIQTLSHRPEVDAVFALGSVLAITLRDPGGKSYASTAAYALRDRLLAGGADGGEEWVVHSRVLGNVWYAMAAMTTSRETIEAVEAKVLAALGA
ncbi:hypothetical protein LTR53_000832 [Teratosphaeriaceae sp. CCFEE 6253]|nr:hypothetical protein LTR53_000832 [Teratosphaeriaceae sp. CCFEE 6253]